MQTILDRIRSRQMKQGAPSSIGFTQRNVAQPPSATGGPKDFMSDVRTFTPGPMPDIPFMDPVHIASQQIQLGLPVRGPQPGAVPLGGGAPVQPTMDPAATPQAKPAINPNISRMAIELLNRSKSQPSPWAVFQQMRGGGSK